MISILATIVLSSLDKKIDENQTLKLTQKTISKKEDTKKEALKNNFNTSENLIDNIFSSDNTVSAIEKPKNENRNEAEKDTFTPQYIDIKNQKVEIEDNKNEFYFVNEKGDLLFLGKRVLLQEGNVEIVKGVDISFKRDENQKLLVGVKSKEYFLNAEMNDCTFINTDFFARFEVLKKSNSIVLSSKSILKVIFQNKYGPTNFKDGTMSSIFGKKSYISDNSSILLIEETKIKDNFAIFFTNLTGKVNLEKIFVGNSWGKINKTIELNLGEITEVVTGVELGEDQIFQVLENNNRPMENCFVYFTEENHFRKTYELDISDYKKLYTKTRSLPLGDTIGLTDNNGFAKTIRFFDLQSGVFECYVFRNTHGLQIFPIYSENKNKIIALKMKSPVHLSLIVKLNNELYLNDIEFNCPFQFLTHGEDVKLPEKITNGRLEIPNILADKYSLALSSNDFQRDELVIDLTNSNKLEYVIDLKPAENFIHGYIKDKNGIPLENINLRIQYNELAYYLDTNEKGYFKFSGLATKTSCQIFVNSDRPITSNLKKEFLPCNEEIIIVLGEADFFSLKVVGLDGKFLSSFSYDLVIYPIQGGITLRGGNAKNGEAKEKIDTYGQYHFTIKIKDAPPIKKIIPILKAEDNVPIVLSAVPGFFVGINILSPDGIPMEDVIVTKDKDLYLAINSQPSLFFITDKSGFIKLENCVIGDFFWLVKKGFSPIPLEIKEENINAQVYKIFTKSFTINGFLHSSKPLASIKIQGISKYNSKYAYYVYSQSEADGSLRIDGLNSGDWLFNIYLNNNDHKPIFKKNIHINEKTVLNIDLDSPTPSNNSLKIIEVLENSIAKTAGLQSSDLIIKYGGKRTLNLNLISAVAAPFLYHLFCKSLN